MEMLESFGCEAEIIDDSLGGIILIKSAKAHYYSILDKNLNVCLMDGRLQKVIEKSYCNLNDPNSLARFEEAIKDMKRLQNEYGDDPSRAARTESLE
jgi:hypothetical protein